MFYTQSLSASSVRLVLFIRSRDRDRRRTSLTSQNRSTQHQFLSPTSRLFLASPTLPRKMIQAVLIFNNKGLPRLTKFYSTTPTPHLQQLLIAEIFSLVSKRPPGSCNFLEGSKMLGGDDVRIIYRHYATLYFVFVVEESESELGILDLIQVRSRSARCAHGRCLWRVSIARSRMCVNWIW